MRLARIGGPKHSSDVADAGGEVEAHSQMSSKCDLEVPAGIAEWCDKIKGREQKNHDSGADFGSEAPLFQCYHSLSTPASASPPLPVPSSGTRSTDTTFSTSSVLNMRTPCVLRPAMRTSSTGTRISLPASVTSMI